MKTFDANTALRVFNNQDLEERELQEKEAKKLVKEPAAPELLRYVEEAFREAADERRDEGIDEKLLDALRRRKGEYSAADLAKYKAQGSSTVFVPLTEQKCNGAEAWMSDVLLPYGDKIWALDPTPLPDLDETTEQGIVAKTMEQVFLQVASTGITPDTTSVEDLARSMREDLEEAREKEARRRADNMEKMIEDQLKESDWNRVFKDFLSNVVTFGTGVLKGPVVRRVKQLEWEKNEPKVSEVEKPLAEAPNPLDIYPSPQATEIYEGYVIERQRMRPSNLLALSQLEYYQEDQIQALLEAREGAWKHKQEQSDDERAELEEKPKLGESSDRMIEVFEFWGPVPGYMLRDWGMKDVEGYVDYEMQVIWSGNYLLKVMPNPDPLGRRPYHKAVYKRTVGSFWGRGVPELMSSSQDRANAAVRSLINNMGIASGPQVVVDINRLPDGEDITHIFPWKVWQVTNEQNLTTRAVEFNQPNSNAKELQEVFLQAVRDSELESGVPAYTLTGEGPGGVGRTASGLSMLMNASSRGIKEAFANIDLRAVGPMIERFYMWNMLYTDNPDIKGDLRVVTRGATGMLLREIQLQKVSEFMDRTNNPVDQQIIGIEGRTRMLREMADLLNLSTKGVVPTDAEMARRKREAEAAQVQAQTLQQQQASQAGGGPNTLGSTPNQESLAVPVA